MTTSSNHDMAEALARRLRNIMGDHNDENVGVETLVRRLVDRQQPTFNGPDDLATWLEALHECHDDGAVGSRKWEPAQVAARAVRSMGKRNEHADAALAHLSTALEDLEASPDQRPVGQVREAIHHVKELTAALAQAVADRDYLVSEYERAVGCGPQGYLHAAMHIFNAITNAQIDARVASAQQGGPLSSRLRPGVECAPWVIKEVHKLEAAALDTALLDWLEQHPRLAQVVVDGKATDCYLYGVSGAPGLKLREIIAVAMQQEKAHGH